MADDRSEVVRRGYDRIAADYLAARVAGGDIDALDDLLARLPPGARMLDAGSGAGVPVTQRIIDGGMSACALDFSNAQLRLARRHVPRAALVQADLVALPFASGSFDAVVSFYAVIHVDRALHAHVFGEVARVLRPGGHALLCLGSRDVPADDDPESWLGVPMFWSHFDRETNLRLVGEAGLAVLAASHVADPMDHGGHTFVLARRPPVGTNRDLVP
ncbi:MAG TPA: class I SAM-dependent methyltransferase [Acidimicrobiia bacterium]|jgi:SAM-dependent methyltransferase